MVLQYNIIQSNTDIQYIIRCMLNIHMIIYLYIPSQKSAECSCLWIHTHSDPGFKEFIWLMNMKKQGTRGQNRHKATRGDQEFIVVPMYCHESGACSSRPWNTEPLKPLLVEQTIGNSIRKEAAFATKQRLELL